MVIKKGQKLEAKISDMAFGGKGITKIDGFTIFVDKSVPGDVVEIRIVKKKKNYAEARVDRILFPSLIRRKAPCEYSGHCGGCKWQAMEYEKQLFYKEKNVKDSVERIGLLKDVQVNPVFPSEQIFGYRNKMEFSFSDRRWLLPYEMDLDNIKKGFALGLHVPGTFFKVLDINACLLQPDLGNKILNDIRTYVKTSKVPVYGLHTHQGFWRFIMLRHSYFYNRWMVNIITSEYDPETVNPLGEKLVKKYPEIVSVVNNITEKKAGVAIGDYEKPVAGDSFIKDKIGPFNFEISANSFFQTNTKGAEKLYQTVRKYARLKGGEQIVDLYSGTGTISIFLADMATEVIGMELVESAVKDAEKNCQRNNVSNCSFIQGDIIKSLKSITKKPDIMIIDPPRTGIHQKIIRQVMDIRPETIVYVSCNPATLARDLGIMKDIYRIIEIQPVDMFPHTYHIESVTRLEKM